MRAVILVCCLLIGCASGPHPGQTLIEPIQGGSISAAKAEATECREPAVPQRMPSPNFKYGCFCGAGHPNITAASGKSDSQLTVDERVELAHAFYRIRPIDDIDAACQAHDTCWLLNGEGRNECNRHFYRRIQYLSSRLLRQSKDDSDSDYRCFVMAEDIGAAALAAMKDDGRDPITGLIRYPFAGWFGIGTILLAVLGDKYPQSSDRCSLRSFPNAAPALPAAR
jgi:hypothetical protein